MIYIITYTRISDSTLFPVNRPCAAPRSGPAAAWRYARAAADSWAMRRRRSGGRKRPRARRSDREPRAT